MKKIYTLLFSIFSFAATLNAQPGNAYDYAGAPGNPGDEAVGDYITLPNGITSFLTADYTIEAWVRWDGGNNFQRIFDFGSSNPPGGGTGTWMFLTPNDGTGIKFAISTTGFGGFQQVVGAAPLSTTGWHHVAVVYQSGTTTLSIYVDGTLSGSGNITIQPSSFATNDQNWLGQSQFHPSAFGDPYFDGGIDELRISNVARYTGAFTPLPVQFATDVSTVALYHFNETSGQTVDDVSVNNLDGFLGSTAAADGNDPSRIANSILPVNIISFSAQKSASGIELKWKASSTDDAGNFIVERSTDGVRFQQAGTIAIVPNTTSNYSFTDTYQGRGKVYYRLRIEELNASPKYSRIVFVDMDGKNSYLAYPTATSSLLFVQIPKPTKINIYNSSGVLVKRMQLEQSQGIEVSGLSKGVYQIQFEGATETLRFIKM